MSLTRVAKTALDELGFVIASHVVSRMSLSVAGGRNEETLTGDIGDLFAHFQLAEEYVLHNSTRESLSVKVAEVNKTHERTVGADFVIVLYRQHAGEAPILKLGGIQAKRVRDDGREYMRGDYLEHAKALVKHFGEQNSWFAFYHNEPALSALPANRASARSRMSAAYVSPVHSGMNCYFAQHPALNIEAYVEPSAYISRLKRMRSVWALPNQHEFGITMFPATHWARRTSTGRVFKCNKVRNVPPKVGHVLSGGWSLSQWLIALAECNLGDNLSAAGGIGKLSEILGEWLMQIVPQFVAFVTIGDKSDAQIDSWLELLERQLLEYDLHLGYLGENESVP